MPEQWVQTPNGCLMSRLRRLRRWWPVLPVAFLALLVYAAIPGRSTFTVSPETTYVTGPLDAEGYVDYQTALNQRLGEGITPETNANVQLWRALGPRPEGGNGMAPEYFWWLGINPPPDEGEYFLGSHRYFEDVLKIRQEEEEEKPADWFEEFFGEPEPNEFRFPPDPRQQWNDRLDRTRKWPWKAKERPDVADWLRRNEKPLAVVAEACRRPKYFNPLVASPRVGQEEPRLISCLLPNVQKCRDIANALVCRAMARVGDGDLDGAWQDLLTCQRLGRHVAHGGTLIENLVGIAIVMIASDGQLTLLSQSQAPADRVRGWLEDLRRLPPMPTFGETLNRGERFVTLDAMMSLARNGPGMLDQLAGPGGPAPAKNRVFGRLFTRSIDWDPALRNANRMYDECVEASRLPDRPARQKELAKVEAGIKKPTPGPLARATMNRTERGEMIGNILIGLLFPALQKVQDASDRVRQAERNLHVAFALAAYRADSGRYPGKLDELVPKYLPEVPGDLFSGGPLIYRPEKDAYLLYSVGPNGADEDGRGREDAPPGDDSRVRMPVPEPKAK